MAIEVEVPDVKVGQRVILLGKDWDELDRRWQEVEIAGFESFDDAYKDLPYFDGGKDGSLYVYRRKDIDTENYSAEVIPLDEFDETTPIHDAVTPGHYKFPGGAEVIDITRHLGFPEGNVVKYVTRARRKTESGLEDLLKARKYLDWAIEDAEAELEP